MVDLRIVDSPEIPTENITGEEKLPTGGSGNYSISLDSLADYTKTKKDLADNTSVDGKVNGVRQELNTHIEDLLNPHQVTKGQIGLGNVDNTADADKPVSNSTQASIISAVAPKADKTYVDNQLTLKANKVDVYTKLETYTKQESGDLVNNSISAALTPINTSLYLAKRGIANRYDPLLTYNSGERVVLANGDIVKSTIDGNTNDPNVDMMGWELPQVRDVFDESGLSQQEINNTVVRIKKSVVDMLAINNPKDGQTVRTISYHIGLSKGGNTYRYEPSRQLENDGGSVLSGWVVQDKTALTVWDFGYKDGDAVTSNIAMQKAFASTFPLKLNSETLDSHNWLEVTNSKNKVVLGCGAAASIINGLKFVFSGSVLIAKNFKILNNEGNTNYAIVVTAYDYVEIDGFDSENTYDSVSIWGARNEKSKAIVRNSNAIKAARVGFCADLGAKNVTFENLKSFDCRQGFHIEDTEDYELSNCESIRCGSGSPTLATDQPLIYAGGFRFHKTKNGVVKHCKNITPTGTSNDWFGGGGSNFKAVGLEGVKFLTDDVANGDPEATFTYADMEFYDCTGFSFINQNFKSIFTGKMVLDHISGGDIELISSLNYLGKSNQITHAYLDNIKCGRIQIDTTAADAVLHMDAVDSATKYYNIIRGWAFFLIGDISYNWLTGDESQYPTLGFRFIGNNAKVFNLNSFTAAGRGGGSQISFESINIPTFKRGYIGNLTATSGAVDMFAGLNFDAYGIVSLGNLQYRPPSVTTAQLQSAPDGINSSNKYVGRDVFNTTTGKFMRATGAASTSTWIATDGSLIITPA